MSDSRLKVVDAVDRSHASKSLESFVVHVVPSQLVHAPAPDERGFAAMAKRHHEPVDFCGLTVDGYLLLHPVTLRLRTRRRFDAAKRTKLRLFKMSTNIFCNRFIRAFVLIVIHHKPPELVDVGTAA